MESLTGSPPIPTSPPILNFATFDTCCHFRTFEYFHATPTPPHAYASARVRLRTPRPTLAYAASRSSPESRADGPGEVTRSNTTGVLHLVVAPAKLIHLPWDYSPRSPTGSHVFRPPPKCPIPYGFDFCIGGIWVSFCPWPPLGGGCGAAWSRKPDFC